MGLVLYISGSAEWNWSFKTPNFLLEFTPEFPPIFLPEGGVEFTPILPECLKAWRRERGRKEAERRKGKEKRGKEERGAWEGIRREEKGEQRTIINYKAGDAITQIK